MTVPLVAAAFFGGNIDETRRFLHEYGYMPKMISKGRFNHRLHAIEGVLWQGLFALLAEVFKQHNPEQTYAVDSLPVAVCDNIFASVAVGFIPHKSTEKRSAATSRVS